MIGEKLINPIPWGLYTHTDSLLYFSGGISLFPESEVPFLALSTCNLISASFRIVGALQFVEKNPTYPCLLLVSLCKVTSYKIGHFFSGYSIGGVGSGGLG